MSTLYDITLKITYLYETPAASSRNALRILPRNLAGQDLISGLVSATPLPGYRRDVVDFFGNAVTEFSYETPVSEIEFRFAGRVRRAYDPPELDLSPGADGLAADLREIRGLESHSPHHFLGESARVRKESAITRYAREQIGDGLSTLAAVRIVNAALNRDMAFDPEATEVDTPLLEAFRARRGVCQDFTHIMIAALRGLGIPAGYVSGFLRTVPPPGQDRLEGADAMHAWVMAWCGAEMGWVQVDPTNNLMVGTDHVVVALGRDYSDVAPVKGAMRSAGAHETRHQVDVAPVA